MTENAIDCEEKAKNEKILRFAENDMNSIGVILSEAKDLLALHGNLWDCPPQTLR